MLYVVCMLVSITNILLFILEIKNRDNSRLTPSYGYPQFISGCLYAVKSDLVCLILRDNCVA